MTVAADAASNVADLSAAAQAHGVTLNVVIEVDAGMGRCGVHPGHPALDLARLIIAAPGLHFAGLHAYEGHVVQNPDLELRTTATEAMLAQTIETRDLLIRHGVDVQTVTCGGTGTYAISGVYPGVTEHQAGSYVYMDPGYNRLIPAFELAFSFLCTVISRPTADKVITDGGGQSLANDYGTPFVKDHPELAWRYHSEEHGSFYTIDGGHAEIALGEQMQVYPATAAPPRTSTIRSSPSATATSKQSGRRQHAGAHSKREIPAHADNTLTAFGQGDRRAG